MDPWTGGQLRFTVDHGQGNDGGLTGGGARRRSRAWNLAVVARKERGQCGEPHRLHRRAAEGRRQSGDGEERLGGGGARRQEARSA
jgi:hypothetical protein